MSMLPQNNQQQQLLQHLAQLRMNNNQTNQSVPQQQLASQPGAQSQTGSMLNNSTLQTSSMPWQTNNNTGVGSSIINYLQQLGAKNNQPDQPPQIPMQNTQQPQQQGGAKSDSGGDMMSSIASFANIFASLFG